MVGGVTLGQLIAGLEIVGGGEYFVGAGIHRYFMRGSDLRALQRLVAHGNCGWLHGFFIQENHLGAAFFHGDPLAAGAGKLIAGLQIIGLGKDFMGTQGVFPGFGGGHLHAVRSFIADGDHAGLGLRGGIFGQRRQRGYIQIEQHPGLSVCGEGHDFHRVHAVQTHAGVCYIREQGAAGDRKAGIGIGRVGKMHGQRIQGRIRGQKGPVAILKAGIENLGGPGALGHAVRPGPLQIDDHGRIAQGKSAAACGKGQHKRQQQGGDFFQGRGGNQMLHK